MFVVIDGIMGSGKTYYAVDYIEKKKNDYYKVFTNINEFKFVSNIHTLNFSKFLNYIDEAKIIFDTEDTNDNDIVNYLVTVDLISKDGSGNVIPSLLVIDEAHNQFDRKNDLLTWLITYHRHLFIDALLITQSYNLIHYSYHKLFEYYLHGIPASRQLIGGKFKYQKYIAVPFNKDTHAGDVFLKNRQVVFDMYKSGDKVRIKSIIRKYFFYFVAAVVLVLLLLYLFIHNFLPDDRVPSTDKTVDNNSTVVRKYNYSSHNSVSVDGYYIKLICISNTCKNDNLNITLNINDLQSFLTNTDSKYLRSVNYSDYFGSVYLLVSNDFLNLFQGAKNEKNHNGYTIFK